jgi:two-component system, sensor histidine kinase and response regulator
MVLTSVPGQGSCFTVLVPLATARSDMPVTQFGLEGFGNSQLPMQAAPLTSQALAALPYLGKRALVVDDHSVNQLLASKLLELQGIAVQVAADGQQAVLAVQANEFDVVLMDIQMPRMDGWQATQQIRQWEHAAQKTRVPIIALSAHASAADREQAVAHGMDGYLSKPLTSEALSAALLKTGVHLPKVAGTMPPLAKQVGASQMASTTERGTLVSRERMLTRVAGDEALLHAMAQAFCTDLRERMGQVHAALQQQDWATVRTQAHALKGALLTMTAHAAAQEAQALELAVQAQDKAGAQGAFANLSKASKTAFDAIKTW